MQLNRVQLEVVSKYLSDISKILVASVVVGFFIQGNTASVTVPIFMAGSVIAGITLWASVRLMR